LFSEVVMSGVLLPPGEQSTGGRAELRDGGPV
jgi:hypothetical protein